MHMSRKPNQPEKGEKFRMNIEVPGDLVLKVDRKAKKLSDETPGTNVTRSEVVRRALYAFVGQP